MDDRRDGEDRRDEGWRPTVMQGLWVILIMIVGWIATDATAARAQMAKDVAVNSQRIAVVEEAQRNIRDSQQRIETTLDEIRRQLQTERRGR